MADVLVSSCAGGRARLYVETDDATGVATAVRCESDVPATITVTRGANTWSLQLGTGVRRVVIPANRQFVLESVGIGVSMSALGE